MQEKEQSQELRISQELGEDQIRNTVSHWVGDTDVRRKVSRTREN